MSERQFGSWREKNRAKLVSQRFVDIRSGSLNLAEDIVTDQYSALQISKQIMDKSIKWDVRYHGVVLPSEFSLGNIDPNSRHYTTKNCINEQYINLFIFENSETVDWYILSPFHSY